MESSIPEWVTKEFFEQCLRKEENNNEIVVTDLIVSPAVPPGNNYGSFIIRVELKWKVKKDNAELKTTKLIVKAELTDGPMKDMNSQNMLFEPAFYYNFLPKARQFGETNFAAKSFFSPKPSVTILEDLKEEGFVMADRTKLLDFEHCRLYMIAAASFHAVSIPVFNKYTEILEPMNKELMFSNESKTRDFFLLMISGGLRTFEEQINKIDRFKKYANQLKELTPNMWDLLVHAHKPSTVINTIRQSDPWVTNMMFKYDKDNKVCGVKVIDFQNTGCGSPVADLMMFLWSSANFEVRKNRLDDLFRIYADHFNENLRKFNCTERFTYEQLKEDVDKLSVMALFSSCSCMPYLLHPVPADFTNFFVGEESDKLAEAYKFYKKFYTEEYCAKWLPQVVESLEINGIFRYLENHKTCS